MFDESMADSSTMMCSYQHIGQLLACLADRPYRSDLTLELADVAKARIRFGYFLGFHVRSFDPPGAGRTIWSLTGIWGTIGISVVVLGLPCVVGALALRIRQSKWRIPIDSSLA